MRPHLDYDDMIYDQTDEESLNQQSKIIQYNAAFAITGATRKLVRAGYTMN